MRTRSITVFLGMSALGAGCIIAEPAPEPPREFQSFRVDWGLGTVPGGAAQSGAIQLDADGTLRLETPCLAGICDNMAPGRYETVVRDADLSAAVAALTDPDLVQLLALERTACTLAQDVDEIMSLAVTGVSYSNQTVLCLDGPIVAARAVLNQLVEDYFQIARPPAAPVLVSAGWDAGRCGVECLGELTMDGVDVRYTITGRPPENPVRADNAGTLTAAGQEAVQSALATLASAQLDEVYGCPNCLDGGISLITLARDNDVVTHRYESNNAPAVLAELDALVISAIAALESCTANQLVDIAADCTPYLWW